MRKLFASLIFLISPLAAIAQYARGDFSLQNAQGQAIAGAQVYILSQPANITNLTPQATIYGNSSGSGTAVCGSTAGLLTQPLITDGFGHACAYIASGTYTVCYVSQYTGKQCYQDQTISLPGGGSGGGSPSPPLGTIQIDGNTNFLSGGTIFAKAYPGADDSEKAINAYAAATPGEVISLKGMSGNWINQLQIRKDNISIDCSGYTFNFIGQDQGLTAGMIDVSANNFSMYGDMNGQPCTLKRGDNSNIQVLMYLRQPSNGIVLHDLILDGNRINQTCPELTCFYGDIKTDPTGAAVSNVWLYNITSQHGIDRPIDFRTVHNWWANNMHGIDCDAINTNYGCELPSFDEGGQYLNGIGGTNILNGGSGYPLTGSTLTYSAPHAGGVQAAATPIIQNGVPSNLTLLTTAHDLTGPPLVSITDSTGKGTRAQATISGQVTSVSVQDGGSFGGTPAGTLSWNNEPGSGGTISGTFAGGSLVSCTASGGTLYRQGYTTAIANSATGTGAFVVLGIDSITGALTGCSVRNGGQDYANSDTLSLSQYGGTGAMCTAQFSSGALIGCQSGTLVGGDGYINNLTNYQLNLTSGTQVTAPQIQAIVTFYIKSIAFTVVTGGYASPTCTISGGGSSTIPPGTCSVSVANGVWTGIKNLNVNSGYFVAGDAAPTVTLTGSGGSGASGVPTQQVQLNPQTNGHFNGGTIENYSDSFAVARCIGCTVSNVTMYGRPYFGLTARPTAGAYDFGDCDGCTFSNLIAYGANGPQVDFYSFDVAGITNNTYHNELNGFIFDPTKTAPGITPQDLSDYDQLIGIGDTSPLATCNDIGIHNGHMVGVRVEVNNCQTIDVSSNSFMNINAAIGIHSAIALQQLTYIPQLLEGVNIHDNIFNTNDGSITSEVLYSASMVGNAPFTQQNNIPAPGIADYVDVGGVIGGSVDWQNSLIKQVTGYGVTPVFRFRGAAGTQGAPSILSNGSSAGNLDWGFFAAAGQGGSVYHGDGFITGNRITSVQTTAPSGGSMGSAMALQALDLATGTVLQNNMLIEPGADVEGVTHYFQNGQVGPATAPTGACTTGQWVFSQDGKASFCKASIWEVVVTAP